MHNLRAELELNKLAAQEMERQRDREKERADRAEQAYADRMKTLAGFQLELDSKKEREESLREQLAAAQRTIADVTQPTNPRVSIPITIGMVTLFT